MNGYASATYNFGGLNVESVDNVDSLLFNTNFVNRDSLQKDSCLEPISIDVNKVVDRINHLRKKVITLQKEIKNCTKTIEELEKDKKELYEKNHKFFLDFKEARDYVKKGNNVEDDFIMEYTKIYNKYMSLLDEEFSSTHKSLLEKKKELEEDYQDSTTNLLTQTKLIKESVKESLPGEELEKITNTTLCSICITNNVNCVLDGCGHTFCIGCTESINRVCPYCRASFKKAIKIFFT
jgi:hypothetical protein